MNPEPSNRITESERFLFTGMGGDKPRRYIEDGVSFEEAALPLGFFQAVKLSKKKSSNIRIKIMKEQYDFSKGERGKFFRSDIKLNLPVYLDDDVLEFVEKIAQKKNIDIQTAVNQMLKSDIKNVEIIQ